jgi:hypothetical protein
VAVPTRRHAGAQRLAPARTRKGTPGPPPGTQELVAGDSFTQRTVEPGDRLSAYDLTYRAAYGLMCRGCGVS